MDQIINLILMVAVIIGAIDGFKVGTLKQGIRLGGWLISIYIAGLFYKLLADSLKMSLPQWKSQINFLAFCVVFGIPFAVVQHLTDEPRRVGEAEVEISRWERHSLPSRIGGALLGAVSAGIGTGISILIIYLLQWTWLNDAILRSSLAPIFISIVQGFAVLLPPELRWWTILKNSI